MTDSGPETRLPTTAWGWLTLRIALFVAAGSIFAYIPYRYLAGSHPAPDSLYGVIFPASALLGIAGLVLAVRPDACACSKSGRMVGGALTVLGVTWMGTGLQCVGYLTRTTIDTPLQGLLETFHMTAQHVFLVLGVVAMVWVPDRLARWCGARELEIEVPEAEPFAEIR